MLTLYYTDTKVNIPHITILNKEDFYKRLRNTTIFDNHMALVYANSDIITDDINIIERYSHGHDVVIQLPNIDKRTKFYKDSKNNQQITIVEPEIWTPTKIKEHLSILTPAQCHYIADSPNDCIESILNTLSVLKTITDNNVVWACGKINKDIFFQTITDVLLKRKRAFIEHYNQLLNQGESNFKLLSVLKTKFANAVLVYPHKLQPISAIQDITGLKYYGAIESIDIIKKRPIQDIIQSLNDISRLEQNIKSGADLEDLGTYDLLLKLIEN